MITVITGIGHNLSSLKFALERLGVEAIFTGDEEQIKKATRVILPGVGTANQAMTNLREKKLVNTIRQLQVPVLGICVGMQILMTSSEEGKTETLNIIPGAVKRFRPENNLTIPHMGWNRLIDIDRREVLMRNIPNESYLYFVHSYYLSESPYSKGYSNHGGTITAVIRKDNFYGVQFHPERSGEIGSRILKNFLEC